MSVAVGGQGSFEGAFLASYDGGLPGIGQADKVVASRREGHGPESSHHRLASPNGSPLLPAASFLRNDS